MKVQRVFTISLIGIFFLSIALPEKKSEKSLLLIQVTVRQKATELWATMRVSNQSAKPVYLNKIDLGMTHRLQNKVFIIKQGEQEIAYTGMLVKRRFSAAADFVLLRPGESLKTQMRLDNSYAFKPGRHPYSIQYRHYHGSPNEPSFLQELTSATHSFDFTRNSP